MFCKKNGGYIAIIIGVMVALSVANKSDAKTFENFDEKGESKSAVVTWINQQADE